MSILEQDIASINMNDLERLATLDAAGFILAPGETAEEFRSRLLAMKERYGTVEKELDEKGQFDLCGEFILKKSDRINMEILEEAAAQTSGLYGFSIDWVPGFFLTGETLPLWGGCAVFLPEEKITVFMIRKAFREKRKWFIYTRDELLSHELCHVARMPVGDRIFEELFAYRTAGSAFRRYAGSCFRTSWDSILFLLPVLVLLAARILETFFSLPIPMLPFWVLAAAYPFFLFCRNHVIRRYFFRARRNLENLGVRDAAAVLFRCTKAEIIEISRRRANNRLEQFLKEHFEREDLRWRVIRFRFIKTEKEQTGGQADGRS